jgi:membrane AbrB-like protein
VLGLSADIRADIRLITLVQSMRLLFLTLIVPVAISFLGTPPAGGLPLVATALPAPLLIMFALSIALGLVLMRLHVPAALLIAGMIVSTAGYLSGVVSGAIPNWLVIPAFLIMGSLIGTRFSGVTLQMLRSTFWAGLSSTAISSAVAAFFALVVAIWLGLPVGQLLVAFMPGGVEAMIAMAVLLEADPTFVAAHHIARLFILTALVPLMIGRRRTSA